jgi:hypothetical protein
MDYFAKFGYLIKLKAENKSWIFQFFVNRQLSASRSITPTFQYSIIPSFHAVYATQWL